MPTIQLRLATSSEWASQNPILKSDEMAKETDTGNLKLGDGVTSYNSLQPYVLRLFLLLASGAAVPAGTPTGTVIFRKT